jgi:hypothetical protein
MCVHNRANASLLHPRACAAEELDIGPMAAECVHQGGGIEIPGCFAGGDENFGGHSI